MSTSSVESPGCVILLIDESASMESAVQEEQLELGQEPKSKGVSIANAVNAILKQLANSPDFDLALVGYRTDDSSTSIAEVRWAGPLTGQEFVATRVLAANPITVETRQRRIPDPSSFSGFRSEPVEVPVWYKPKSGGIAPQVMAFAKCKDLLTRWSQTAGPNPGQPLVIHLFAAGSGDGNPTRAIEELKSIEIGGRQPLVFQAHLSTAKAVPPTLYTSNRTFLAPGPARDLFERSSVLPPDLVAALKSANVIVGANARGMLFNANLLDVVRLLGLIKSHVKNWPARPAAPVPPPIAEAIPVVAAATEAVTAAVAGLPLLVEPTLQLQSGIPFEPLESSDEASPLSDPIVAADDGYALADPVVVREKAALVVFLLDRSVNDPFAADSNNPFQRLQEQVNDWLSKLAKKPTGQIEVAMISYGVDSVGDVEVRNTFEAGLSGQTVVTDTDLESGTIRIHEFEQQIPNGIGGLITLPQKQLILVELEPTNAAPPQAAFEATAAAITEWSNRHPLPCCPPVVLHLTRGQHSAEELEVAVTALTTLSPGAGPVLLYHAIATEAPHSSVSYTQSDTALDDPGLKAAFAVSSTLLGREELAISKPALVKPQSRGIVINGKFELLLDGIRETLSRE